MKDETKMRILSFTATALGIAGSLLSGALAEKRAKAQIKEAVKAELAEVNKTKEESKTE